MRKTVYLATVLGLVARGGIVHADPGDWFPAGMTTDRVGTESWAANLELAYNAYDDDFAEQGTLLRYDLYGQYLAHVDEYRLGGYAWVPIVQSAGTGDSEVVVGNPELGAALAMAVDPATNLVFRGGLVVSTVEGFDDLGILLASFGRVTDAYTSVADVYWLRTSGSVLHRGPPYFVRADLGVDVPLPDFELMDPLLRFNAAGGMDLHPVVLMAELATLTTLQPAAENRVVPTLSLTARIRGRTYSPAVSLVVPIDEDVQGFLDLAVVAGIRIAAGP